MASPSYDELVARLDALEAKALGLKDLPIAALQRKLEQDWQPQASILLGENSITEEMLADDAIPWDIGASQDITWPGGAATQSNEVTLTHGLGRVPDLIIPTLIAVSGLNTFPAWPRVRTYTATNCLVRTGTVDGQTPLVTATATVRLLAIG